MPLTPQQQSYRARLTAESGALTDPDATGALPVGTGGTGRLLRFPVHLRIAPAAVALPMIRPDADEAAALVERAARECRNCHECALYVNTGGDGRSEPRAWECSWGESSRNTLADCMGFDPFDYDAEAWGRVADAVCDIQPAQVA